MPVPVPEVRFLPAEPGVYRFRDQLERRRPTWNRTVGGAENPLLIRVDSRDDRPSLRAVHLPQPTDQPATSGHIWAGRRCGGR